MIPKIKSVKRSHNKYRQFFLAIFFVSIFALILLSYKSNVRSDVRKLQPQTELSDTLPKSELPNFEHLLLSSDKIQMMTTSRELGENRERPSDRYRHKLQISSPKKSHEQIKEEDHLEGKSISPVKNPEQAQQQAISKTLTNIDKCMSESNLTSPALLENARENALWSNTGKPFLHNIWTAM